MEFRRVLIVHHGFLEMQNTPTACTSRDRGVPFV